MRAPRLVLLLAGLLPAAALLACADPAPRRPQALADDALRPDGPSPGSPAGTPGDTAPGSRLLCPEYPAADSGGAERREAREPFQPEFEIATKEGAEAARAVDDLFREAWERGLVQPRAMLNELVRSATVEVHDVRNRVEGEPWAERVTARQVERVEQYRRALQGLVRGESSPTTFLLGLRHLSLRVLLACPATLQDRRVQVPGTVSWERSKRAPHDVVALYLEDDDLRVPLQWAGEGPVAEIHPRIFGSHAGVGSWWRVSVRRVDGAAVVRLHDFLGNKSRGAPETLPEFRRDTMDAAQR